MPQQCNRRGDKFLHSRVAHISCKTLVTWGSNLTRYFVLRCPLRNGVIAIFAWTLITITAPFSAGAADSQLSFQYLQQRNYPKALECFNAALKEHPGSWQTMQNIGNCQMELGHYDRAIASFQKSIEVGGLHAGQCVNLAAVYQRSGQPKQALNWLKLACSIDPAKASDPTLQANISKLQDPMNNPNGSLTAPDYLSSMVSFKGWHKESMPLKVYVRKNIQLPQFYESFVAIVRDSFDQWCASTPGAISYKLVNSPELANIVCDYTDHRELVSSQHELGIDGNTEMLVKQDRSPGPTSFVVLVKDGPVVPVFRDRNIVSVCCLHEVGHALGMHGHSPSSLDVMFPAVTPGLKAKLSERDKR
jgi:Tfp pilus assembly protein PilF